MWRRTRKRRCGRLRRERFRRRWEFDKLGSGFGLRSDRKPIVAVHSNNRSLKYWRCPRQDLGHKRVRNGFQLFPAARGKIESAELVASDNPRRFCACFRQGHGETSHARETSAAGDGQNYGDLGDTVEWFRGNYQHRTPALLFVA